jgi:serine/threonine protein kinase
VGELYERYVADRDQMPHRELFDRHPYFRLMNDLSFLFEESSYHAHRSLAQVMVREYLDGRYLRLSLAGIMPDVEEGMAAMPYHWSRNKISTPYPRLGRYGILDQEDLNAWKKVEVPFRDMGFALIRQLGIGQFGRVYEACNQYNPHLPRHIAIKIDRIVRGKKKEAIQSAEQTMRIGEDLATAPHVIRIFDAGKLKGKRFTYHLLQLVDGDTLDNLVGISGIEHASMLRPRSGRRSEREIQQDYLKAVKKSTREIWRRQRMSRPFVDPLELSQTLDLLTSILLWLEEIHRLNYAVNDLKNGNLMVSRRGQLKGIDLDSYSPITDPLDRATDFFFLAFSLLLLLLNINRSRYEPMAGCEGLLQSRDALLQSLVQAWPFGDVAQLSSGRVASLELLELLVDLIDRSRTGVYAHAPDRFSGDIDRLISLKRRIFSAEIVLD